MTPIVRPAIESDAAQYLELLTLCLGEDYPSRDIFMAAWCAAQLHPKTGHETWVVEGDGRLHAAVSLLKCAETNTNRVINLGRHLAWPESYTDGSGAALLQRVNELGRERQQMLVARVLAADNAQQVLYENLGYVCVGFQPEKHLLRARQGVLFYVLPASPVLVTRLPLSDSLSQISDLARLVLEKLNIASTLLVHDVVTGYPLNSDLKIEDAVFDDFEWWRLQSQTANPAREISSGFKRGTGLLRIDQTAPLHAMLGQRNSQVVAGIAYFYDEHDYCVRVLDAFASDYFSLGPLLTQTTKMVQEKLSPAYIEVDILMNARRLLKCAEQLGFVPVAYLPAFCAYQGNFADVVKMVKLNSAYTLQEATLTAQAGAVVQLIDSNFQDVKVGVAIINLLRFLPIFTGLGDGELRKIARLSTQKLYRTGETVFKKGEPGIESYVVLRGQVDIVLDEKSTPTATIQSGQIFGELAFLDGAPRTASAVASQPTILLIMQRTAFNDLVQGEPHLGMVVLRNIALDLAGKLRRTNRPASEMSP